MPVRLSLRLSVCRETPFAGQAPDLHEPERRCGQRLLSGHRLSLDDLIVICDDLALPVGRIRIRARGGAGGHNGLKSIIEALGTREFIRVRMGIAPEGVIPDAAEFVLSPVPPDRAAVFRQMIHKGAEAVESVCLAGVDEAMNRFNPVDG